MENKTSVFSGQSGVGKSSLINAVLGSELPIGPIALKTNKGSHTTTAAELIPLENEGFCIDTPGIKSFGLWENDLSSILEIFPIFLPLHQIVNFPTAHIFMNQIARLKKPLKKKRFTPCAMLLIPPFLKILLQKNGNKILSLLTLIYE